MKTKILSYPILLFLLLLNSLFTSAQCPSELVLSSQEQVDNFLINYPNCTIINGDVEVIGDNISNLNSFTNLTSVNGDLTIRNCPLLSTLSGLEQLDTVNGTFQISGLGNLSNLDELENLTYIGQTLDIGGNSSLNNITGLSTLKHVGNHLALDGLATITSIEGLEQITEVPGFLWVRNCHMLTNLEGLQNIETVGRDVVIRWNFALADISGLRSLKTVGEDLDISFADELYNLDGLDSLIYVGDLLNIGANDNLREIEALSNLKTIGGNIGISGNPVLESLKGLDLLEFVGGNLWLRGNPMLSDCAAFGFCAVIESFTGENVEENAEGCNTLLEIQSACETRFGEVNGLLFRDFDCDTLFSGIDLVVPNTILKQVSTDLPFAFTNDDGLYESLLPAEAELEFYATPIPGYSTIPSSHILNTGPEAELFSGYDFAYCPDSIFHNLKVYLDPYDVPRPGFTNSYEICVENLGVQVEIATLEFQFDESLDASLYEFTETDGGTVSDNIISWDVAELNPFQRQCFSSEIYLDPTVPLDTELISSANVQLISQESETNLSDNIDSLIQIVFGSYDPNDKTVTPDIIFDPNLEEGDWLEYRIRFQNTGTFPATFVEVLDTIEDKLDLRTFTMESASHSYELSFPDERVLKWRFDNINLPDSTSNEPESHGFIRFRIKTVEQLDWSEPVRNRAGIYFDFNEVVLTNYAETNKGIINSAKYQLFQNEEIKVFPNPALNKIWVEKNGLPIKNLELFNTSGSLVKRITAEGQKLQIDLVELEPGIYFLKSEDVNSKIIMNKLVILK